MDFKTTVCFLLFVCILSRTAGRLQLVLSGDPAESAPLTLKCQSDRKITREVRFYKNRVVQGRCDNIECATDKQRYTVTQTDREAKLIISAVKFDKDAGEWGCVLLTYPLQASNKIEIKAAVVGVNWEEVGFSPEWTSLTSITPEKTIIFRIYIPCTSLRPIFSWKYRTDSDTRLQDFPGYYSDTYVGERECPPGQRRYISSFNLPGKTPSFYNKRIILRVTVEHGSFRPPSYTKHKDSRSILFPILVSSVTLAQANTGDGKLSLLEGQAVLLTCVTSPSYPASGITWLSVPEEVKYLTPESQQTASVGSSFTTTVSARLTVTRADQGKMIYCEASNIGGQAPVHSYRAQLNVYYPPSKPLITTQNEMCAGSLTTLVCSSSEQGHPEVTYSWTKNGNSVNTSVTSDGSQWRFTPSEDDDGADVRCSAGNAYTDYPGYSRIQSDVTRLKVHYTPALTVLGNLTESEGQNLTLTCISDPEDAVITWTHPGGAERGSTLTITNLSRNHTGNYTCNGRIEDVCSNTLESSEDVSVIIEYETESNSSEQTAMRSGGTVAMLIGILLIVF